jgi:hypothetical protein
MTSPRDKRLRDYANPNASEWRGQSTVKNIDRWAKRAEKESDGDKHRAKSGPVELPPTGEMSVHSTHRTGHMVGDPYDAARKVRNHEGSDFMASVKRIT